jgi:hypothetical protein
VTYKLDLPWSFAGIHDIFHMLQLKKCLMAPVDVMLPEVTPLEADLSYPKHPIKVFDQKDRVMRHKMIKFFKVQSNDTEEEATWESEDFIHSRYPSFILPSWGNVRLFAVPIEPLLLQNLRSRFMLGGWVVTHLVLL